MPTPFFKVYLAGPITGCSWGECTDWRADVKSRLEAASGGLIKCYSPLRSKEYLSDETVIKDFYPDTLSPMSTQRGIYTRDRNDVKTSDLIFANFLGSERVSIGTVMEVAWADAWDIPIVGIMEKEKNFHDHSMMREAQPFLVDNVAEALLLTLKILLP